MSGTRARSGRQGGAPSRTSGYALLASRPGNPIHQQLTGRQDVFAPVPVVTAVDVTPEEIRAIALVTAVGQGDPVQLSGMLP